MLGFQGAVSTKVNKKKKEIEQTFYVVYISLPYSHISPQGGNLLNLKINIFSLVEKKIGDWTYLPSSEKIKQINL